MNRNIFEAIIGGLILVLVIVLVYCFTVSNNFDNRCYKVLALFSDVSGISVGSSVMAIGIKIGSVTMVKFDNEAKSARVSMCIQNEVRIPDDSSAKIGSSSIMGDKNIVIQFGASDTILSDGEEISYTQAALSLDVLINKFLFKN